MDNLLETLRDTMGYIYKGIHGEIIQCCIAPQYRLILGEMIDN